MYVFIELWRGNAAWKSATPDARREYMSVVESGNATLAEMGIKSLAWAPNDPDISRRADYDYFAIWECESKDAAKQFESIIESIGWFDYFDQVHVGGIPGDPVELSLREAELGN